jgi:hypothetical protein
MLANGFWGRITLGGFFDAPKPFGEWFPMHPNVLGKIFRCTQTFLEMIFDAPKHFW